MSKSHSNPLSLTLLTFVILKTNAGKLRVCSFLPLNEFIHAELATESSVLLSRSGIMRPGLNAILGPTGSGKSS